ncbi:unnamed protein product [Chironomus riparius]|uniref:N-acylneuraminate cytidylyltransferase n=1 Tax=Chironomus riparius TaxID=315576 RepID=A0A9P0NCK4_9DIPT|nr:unnamed protein product [Chironomus riparius]
MLKISIVVSFFSTLLCHVDCHNNFSNDDSSAGIIALILARGGSKGIKMKNIQMIDGTTLLGISLKEIQKAEIFESIWVSTDDDEIAKEGLKYNANIHERDPQHARDESKSIDAVQEFLLNHPNISRLALIQCTSPFISHQYLREAFHKFTNRDCVFSAVKSFKLRWKYADDNRKKIVPINFDYRNRPRRQDWDGEFIEAGMFYFTKRELLNEGLFQNDNCDIVQIKNEDSLEIDRPDDLELARVLNKYRKTLDADDRSSFCSTGK